MKKTLHSVKSSTLTLILLFTTLFFTRQSFAQTVVNSSPGASFTVPANVTSMKVEVWGGGGGGGGCNTGLAAQAGSSGGGGAYQLGNLVVSPGQIYTIAIGAGGAVTNNGNGGAGGVSSVSGTGGTVTAAGGGGGGANKGTAGAGGAGTRNGGAGGVASSQGAGGGGGAGNNGNGSAGANAVQGLGGTGNPNNAPYVGGNGGANRSTTGAGNPGAAPGGGGGGGFSAALFQGARTGGLGGAGQVVLTYCITPLPTAPSPVNFCQNATAVPLTATGTALKWYTVATGGTGATTAPTPSTATLGTTIYYVSQTIGGCEGARRAINVVVNPNSTISRSSAVGTDAQTVCIDNPITDITYTIGGVATGASITAGALPAGVTGSFSGGVFTITGTPIASGVFNYTVSATGSCSQSLNGSITVNANSTIILSSVSGTDAQSLCALTPLTNITYAIGGGGTGASITAGALPAGVTGSFSGGVFTISGSPTVTGNFSYTVTTSGPCINNSLSGTITVFESSSITLSSGAGTDAQTVCIDNPITDIAYTIGGSATGGSITGGALPAGVTGSFADGVFTITGTPTASGLFNYTFTATGPCPVSINGSILVNANSTITFSSATGTDAQTLCALTPLTNITYAIGGGGTGASITSGALPAGVTGSFSGGVFTISGTPTVTGVFSYTVSASGPCINPSLSGTITVNESSAISLTSGTGTDAQTVCINNAIFDINYTIGGSATGASLTGGALPAGVSGAFSGGDFSITGIPTVAGVFNYTITATGPCPVTISGSMTVLGDATIALSSAAGTDAQTKCVNTPITPITYSIGGTGTGASVLPGSLPPGVTGTYNAGVFTISGTPSQPGVYGYTVSSEGPCVNPTLDGFIIVEDNGAISLLSVGGTDAQTVCINNPITDITYSIGGTATGASLTGPALPAGLSGSFADGVFTLTGTPTVSGVFTYTVTTTGSPCINPSISGTLTVIANSTVSLTSAAGTSAQSLCVNTVLTNITYAVGGGGTGATVSGLPAGVTGAFNAGVFTISGTPTAAGNFNYTVTTTGPCINTSIGGTITVITNSTLTLSSANNIQTVCQNSAIANINYTYGGSATGVTATGLPAGVTGAIIGAVYRVSGTPTVSGIFNYTLVTSGPCVNRTRTGTITVNPLPTGVSVTPAAATICVGASRALTANGALAATTLINDNFEGTSVFTAAGTASGDRSQIFQPEVSGVNVNTVETFTNGTGNIRASTVADGGGGLTSGSVSTTLTSPTLNTTGYTLSTFTFKHVYRQGTTGSGVVEVSTNAGVSWTPLTTYTTNQGAIATFATVSINLAAFSDIPSLIIRFNFNSSIQNFFNNTEAWWAIDDVVLNATPIVFYSWTANTGAGINGLPGTAGTPSVSNKNISVNPTQTTTYTMKVQGQNTGCFVSGTSTVTVNQNSTLTQTSVSGTETQTVCIDNPITNITYAVGGGGTGASITAGALPAGVTGSFSGGVFTITGTPAVSGTFNYTVTTTGPCVNVSLSGTMTVNANSTISLSSAPGTDAQTICINTLLTNITYSIGGGGTGASITSGVLPAGVTGSFSGGVFTIAGTPTESGSFSYTVTTTGLCINNSLSGTITVNANSTMSLSSAAGTDAQNICINTPLTDITYAIGGGGTGASIASGTLPTGITGSFNGGVFTISGTPTQSGSFSYTITTAGPCVNPSLSGTITVGADGTITLSSATGTDAQNICINNPITNITYAVGGGGTGASITSGVLPAGITSSFSGGVFTISGTATESGHFPYTVSVAGPCSNASLSGSITVTPDGTITLTSAAGTDAQTLCINTPLTNINYTLGGSAASASITAGTLPAGVTGSNVGSGFTISGTPTESGSFSYTLTTAGPCINASVSGTITVNMPPVVSVISGPTNACPYTGAATPNPANYSVSSSDPLSTYAWTVPAGVIGLTGQGTNSISFRYPAGFTSGTVSVTVTGTCGTPEVRTLSITSSLPATPGPITGVKNVCPYIGSNTELTYSVPAVAGANSYNWVVPVTITIMSGQGTNSINVKINNGFIANANKQIRVSAVSGCGTTAQAVLILLAQFPITPGPITGPTNVCPYIGTGTATYTIRSVVGATSYIWSAQSGTTTIVSTNGPGVNDTTVTVSFTNGFTTSAITVQAANACGTSGTRSLSIVRNNPAVGSITGPTNACPYMLPNGIAATYSVVAVAGVTFYNWTTPAGSVVTHPNGTGPNDNTITVQFPNGFTSGSISVSVTNGCGTGAVKSLAIGRLLPATPSIIDVIQTQPCPDRVYTYTLSAMPANATAINWTVPPTSTLVSGQGTTSITVSYPSTSIDAAVTAKAVNNCGSSVVRSTSVKLPACETPPPPPFARSNGDGQTKNALTVQPGSEVLDVMVFPNPSVNDFKVKVITAGKEVIQVRVLDMQGRAFSKTTVLPYQTITIGNELKAGAYLLEVVQGNNKMVKQVLKF